jgi:trimeric autotransporter adhesin
MRTLRAIAAGPALAAALLGAAAPQASGQQPLDAPVTDGPVESIALANGRVYLAGGFSYVGPPTGSAVRVDPATGRPSGRTPRIDGAVLAAAPDGAGGFYVGGAFGRIDGAPHGPLAHVLADGTLDPRFNPAPDGPVFALTLAGGRLYVGGAFTSIGGRARNRLAAIDVATGAVDPAFDANLSSTGIGSTTSPGVSSNSRRYVLRDDCAMYGDGYVVSPRGVFALAAEGERLYVGGSFDRAGGIPRDNLAALDARTGALDPSFDPDAATPGRDPSGTARRPDADGPVLALALAGGRLFLGGDFDSIAGRSRGRIAAVDAATGAVDGSLEVPANGTVRALAVAAGRLFAGGHFTTLGGVSRPRLGAIDLDTGAVGGFDPRPSGSVLALSAADGTLHAGGAFESIAGADIRRLAALDPRTGALVPGFDAAPSDSVAALAIGGREMLVGGAFASAGGTRRPGLAALDARTLALDERFEPPQGFQAGVIAVDRRRVYASGRTGEQPRIAAFDARTGADARGFRAPDLGRHASDLAVAGGRLYAAGASAAPHSHGVVALDARSGRLQRRFQARVGGAVRAIEVAGGRVYVGGAMLPRGIRAPRGRVVRRFDPVRALDPLTGARERGFRSEAWLRYGYDGVEALALSRTRIYAGGGVDLRLPGDRRAGIAAIERGSGRVDRRFRAPADLHPSSLAVAAGLVLVDGAWARPDGNRFGVSALDARTGRPDGRVSLGAAGNVCALAAGGGRLYAGGGFRALEGLLRPGFAAFALPR